MRLAFIPSNLKTFISSFSCEMAITKTKEARMLQHVAMFYFVISISLFSSVKGQCSQSGIKLSGTSGSFSSPNYPSNYPNSKTCRWIITVPQDHYVRLSFQSFQMEICAVPSPVCSCDHLEVRDGTDSSAERLGRYCGEDKPSVVQSSGRSLWIEFDSDLTGNKRGFSATYNAVAIPVPSTSFPTSTSVPGGNRCSDQTESRDYCPRSSDDPSKTECCFVDGKASCCNKGSYCHDSFGWDISNAGCIGATIGIILAVVFLLLVVCLCCRYGSTHFEWCCFPFVMCCECCEQPSPKCSCSGCKGSSCKSSGDCSNCNCCDEGCCDGLDCGGGDCDCGGGDCC